MALDCLQHASIVKSTEIARSIWIVTVRQTHQFFKEKIIGLFLVRDQWEMRFLRDLSFFFFSRLFVLDDDCISLRTYIDNCAPVRGFRDIGFDYYLDVDADGNIVPQAN